MIQTKNLDLFAGIPVADYAAALAWYEQLLGFPPTFFPNAIEAVWQLAEHRYVYIGSNRNMPATQARYLAARHSWYCT